MSHTSGRAPTRSRRAPTATTFGTASIATRRLLILAAQKKRGYSIILSTATSRCGAGNPVAGGRVQADWLAMSRETINAFGGRNGARPILTHEAEKDYSNPPATQLPAAGPILASAAESDDDI